MLSAIAQREAEYTAAIVIDTKRNSVAMRTIAVLGIVFLPGTFVATRFSVDMFDWGNNTAATGADAASDGGTTTAALRASPSMWVYWAISVTLTILTFLAWFLWSRRENRKSDQRLMIRRTKPPGPSLGASATVAALRFVGLGRGERLV
ncbi:hypothetical protein PG984_015532 [Apiospora sp. TS-2023a]